MNRGLFIVLEGIDGAGTTTQCRRLSERLGSEHPGLDVTITAEPTTRPVGRMIRDVLKGRLTGTTPSGESSPFDLRALALLFAADRLDHVVSEVEPLLAGGHVVLADRYVLSSLAYQGMDAPRDWVAGINRFAPRPDVTFFIDVPPEVAWQRIRSARSEQDLFETPDTLNRVAAAYREAIDLVDRDGLVELDGTLSETEVSDRIWNRVEVLL